MINKIFLITSLFFMGLMPINLTSAFSGSCDNGVANDPCHVFTCAELQSIEGDCAASNPEPEDGTPATLTTCNRTYILEDDLDCGGMTFECIGLAGGGPGGSGTEFLGNFNGKNHTISDLILQNSLFPSGANKLGFFCQTQGAQIFDLKLVDVVPGPLLAPSSSCIMGGLIGISGGISSITNVHTSNSNPSFEFGPGEPGDPPFCSFVGGLIGIGQTDIIDSSSSLNLRGGILMGGLVGDTGGSIIISNSHTTGNVLDNDDVGDLVGGLVGDLNGGLIIRSSATGNLSGNGSVGGLVGRFSGNIQESFATGNVETKNQGTDPSAGGLVGFMLGGDISNSYARGEASNSVVGNARVGGLVGNFSGTISNSYATGAALRGQGGGGLVGLMNPASSITSSFSTGATEIIPPLDEFNGGLVGFRFGGDISNSYYNNTVLNSGTPGSPGTPECIGTDFSGFGFPCIGIDDDEAYFYLASNQPMASWGFPSVWLEVTGDFPALAWEILDEDDDGVSDPDDLCDNTAMGATVDLFGCETGVQCPSGAATCADYAIIEYDDAEDIINSTDNVEGNEATVTSTTTGTGTGKDQLVTFTIPDQGKELPEVSDFGPTVIFIEDTGSTSGIGFVGALFNDEPLSNAIIIGPADTTFDPPAILCMTFDDGGGFCCDLDGFGIDSFFIIGKDGDGSGFVGDSDCNVDDPPLR